MPISSKKNRITQAVDVSTLYHHPTAAEPAGISELAVVLLKCCSKYYALSFYLKMDRILVGKKHY